MPWYPGQVQIGSKVFAEPVIFASGNPPVFQRGIVTIPQVITTPATVPSPGTVTNNTGYDVMVYASSTTGISKAVIQPGGTIAGTVAATTTADFYLAAGAALVLTYTGTLTWLWLAI